MAKKLSMTFKTAEGKIFTMNVDEPKDGLTEAEVRAVMDAVVAENAFNTSSGDVVAVKSAEIVTTAEEILI